MSERNQTIRSSEQDRERLRARLASESYDWSNDGLDCVVHAAQEAVFPRLPDQSIDLVFADPPYNLDKVFGAYRSRAMPLDEYEEWAACWLDEVRRVLRPTGTSAPPSERSWET